MNQKKNDDEIEENNVEKEDSNESEEERDKSEEVVEHPRALGSRVRGMVRLFNIHCVHEKTGQSFH